METPNTPVRPTFKPDNSVVLPTLGLLKIINSLGDFVNALTGDKGSSILISDIVFRDYTV